MREVPGRPTMEHDGWRQRVRRLIDVIVGGVIALAAVPLIAALAVIGVIVFRANPFFVQERVGLRGRPFQLWKLRSMPPDAPAYVDKYALREVEIPRWGRLIRRLHLDELPQLLHVPQGRMSLVGPRPEMVFLHEQMPDGFARSRVSVRPGCTGLWQVSVASARLILEAPQYDRLYVEQRNWRLDLWILVRTVLQMLHLTRPVELGDVPRWALRRGAWRSADLVAGDAVRDAA